MFFVPLHDVNHVSIHHSSLLRSGNPGLLDHYVPFLNAIHRESVSESSDPDSNSTSNASPSSSVTIFAHAHLGLSSYIGIDGPPFSFSFPEPSSVALPAQIEAHLEFLDELLAAYAHDGGPRHPAPRVLLVGHSIGAWFVQELLKARASARGVLALPHDIPHCPIPVRQDTLGMRFCLVSIDSNS